MLPDDDYLLRIGKAVYAIAYTEWARHRMRPTP